MDTLERIAHFAKVPIVLEAMLDCGPMPVESIIRLQEGSVIRTLTPAGDNMLVRVGGKLVGYGEISGVEAQSAIRITNFTEIE